MTRIGRFSRGIAALVTLLALLGGVPVALTTFVGRPWPRPLPTLDTVWRSIRAGDLSDTTVIKVLAVVVWIAWVRLACSVLVELAARVSGRQAPRLAGLGSSQRWAAALVAAVVVLVGVGPRGAFASSTSPVPRPIPTGFLNDQATRLLQMSAQQPRLIEQLSSHEIGRAGALERGDEQPTRTHVVQRYESFWSIAEETLGDGSRWRDIVALNNGREVATGIVFDGTAHRLLPGWTLLVPVDGVVTTARPPADAGPPPTSDLPTDVPAGVRIVVVDAGDTLSGIAAEQLGSSARWPELWDANHGREFAGRVFDDPNLILTGWQLIVPDVFSPPPVETPPAALSPDSESTATSPTSPTLPSPGPAVVVPDVVVPDVVVPSVVVAERAPRQASGSLSAEATVKAPPTSPPLAVVTVDDARTSTTSLGGLGAAVLLASGVIGAVGVRRRRQLRSATINARLAEPSNDSVATEQALRRLGGGDRVARLDIALRAAAHELVELGSRSPTTMTPTQTTTRTPTPTPVVLGAIMSSGGRLDLLLSTMASAPPAPWQAIGDHCWRLPAGIDLAEIADAARQSGQPCPAMAHLGLTPSDLGEMAELFIDLEAIGLLTVDGSPEDSAVILRAIAAGVSVSPMSETAHIIVTGLEMVDLGHPSATTADSLDAALDLAASAVGATAAMTAGGLSTFVLRARHRSGEAWEPAIVFASESNSDAAGAVSDSDLLDLTTDGGRGLAVVMDRVVAGAVWSIRSTDSGWRVLPLGLELTPIGLTIADVGRIETLLLESDRPLFELLSIVSAVSTNVPEAHSGVIAPDLEWTLMVRILGPVAVVSADGTTAEFERSKALELVAWLSQHRDRSTRTGARTALWETNVRDATFANVVSDARRNLARLTVPADGEEWIGRTLTEHLPLHRRVVTDADVLRDRLDATSGLRSEAAILVLRPALELIRDVPFSGTSYLWPDTEGITSRLTLLTTSAAAVLAGHYLSLGDTDGVFWATGQGLKVLPGHEELISLRMRAHGRQGDLAGVRHEWDSYERVLNGEAWSDGEPSPKLVALRRELLSLR